ncbi:hypothetical protein GMDG_01565 [Pseudogymnoascus destructans 20631-21]|uniref:Aminoglycoside phosphotransferase domain-containing protein n=1 Tax=Pseudogymnoascus destructans (strain ATCC MYA-4855 / 20631-21) TaxID=658429 RepID=L8FV10_PSED2|nr:hypothetical protein GMDG_01565 [Pseudogymnoascus destructans 20631-21]
MAGAAFQGLEWAATTFGLEPTWTLEPDLEAAKQIVKEHSIRFTKFPCNKNEQTLILRLALPVDPRYKTLSEVATMEWMRHNANVPVPTVVSHDASSANPVGFEWILMTKLPGKQLADAWRSLSYPAKEGLAKPFAKYSSSLFKIS